MNEKPTAMECLESGNASLRLRGLRDIGAARDGAAVERVAARLRDTSRAVQEAARDCLVEIGGREVVAHMTALLGAEDAATRNLAVEVLGQTGADAPELLYETLKKGSDDVKMYVLDALGALGYAPAVDEMAGALESSNLNVRNACVMAMSRMALPTTIPYLLKALEDDEWVCFSAIEGLCKIGGARVLPTLIGKLKEARGGEYYPAILSCFIEMRAPEAIAPLLEELAHGEARYHGEIAAALLELLDDHPEAAGDVDEALRRSAAPALSALFNDADPWTAFRALGAVARLGGREHFDGLLAALENENVLVQAGAVKALESLVVAADKSRLESIAAKPGLAIAAELGALLRQL